MESEFTLQQHHHHHSLYQLFCFHSKPTLCVLIFWLIMNSWRNWTVQTTFIINGLKRLGCKLKLNVDLHWDNRAYIYFCICMRCNILASTHKSTRKRIESIENWWLPTHDDIASTCNNSILACLPLANGMNQQLTAAFIFINCDEPKPLVIPKWKWNFWKCQIADWIGQNFMNFIQLTYCQMHAISQKWTETRNGIICTLWFLVCQWIHNFIENCIQFQHFYLIKW